MGNTQKRSNNSEHLSANTDCYEYHAVGNYYLKHSWEYHMQKKNITYSFIVDNPNILGNFLLFVGQNQLGDNYLMYSHIWGSQNTLGKKCITHSGYCRPSK